MFILIPSYNWEHFLHANRCLHRRLALADSLKSGFTLLCSLLSKFCGSPMHSSSAPDSKCPVPAASLAVISGIVVVPPVCHVPNGSLASW